MHRAVTCLAVAAALVASPANANHSGFTGGCTLSTTFTGHQGTPFGTFTLAATSTPAGSTITLTCVILVDGVTVDTLSAAGIGAAANAKVVSFFADSNSTVQVCEYAVVDGHVVPPPPPC